MTETEKIKDRIRIMVRENRGNERTHQWASILYDMVAVIEEQQRQIDGLILIVRADESLRKLRMKS